MVVGLSAAALQGAPVVTQDIDLWFENLNDPGLARALAETGAAYVPPSRLAEQPSHRPVQNMAPQEKQRMTHSKYGGKAGLAICLLNLFVVRSRRLLQQRH
jgi:hypothetical protein